MVNSRHNIKSGGLQVSNLSVSIDIEQTTIYSGPSISSNLSSSLPKTPKLLPASTSTRTSMIFMKNAEKGEDNLGLDSLDLGVGELEKEKEKLEV
jgi:hypothetical protein